MSLKSDQLEISLSVFRFTFKLLFQIVGIPVCNNYAPLVVFDSLRYYMRFIYDKEQVL